MRDTLDAVWKAESARIVAALTRLVRDVGLAEELAQDALVAALEQWPSQGVPDNPGAWLMTIAKRRAIDHIRRSQRLEQIAQPPPEQQEQQEDDVLRLMFISCHPVLPARERAALTLRLLGGLSAAEIGRAFLLPEQVIAQRIAAAKRTLAERNVPFELPEGSELAERLASVLEVIYLIFNEGYSATSGDDLMRPALTREAMRLGGLLAELAPHEAEVHGLVALMEIQASRAEARTGPSGEPIQLHEQDRSRWDRQLINRGFASMLRARQAGGPLGPYVLQAAIAVSHAQAASAEQTDWAQIAALYEALVRMVPSPVIQLNRAVALGMAGGPQAGLDLVDTVSADPALRDYHLLSVVRGDLLERLGRQAEASREFTRAAALTRNEPERAFLLRRAGSSAPGEATVGDAVSRFLARDDLGAETLRSYGQTMRRLLLDLGAATPLAEVSASDVARVFAVAWGGAGVRTWNRHRAAVRALSAWTSTRDLAAGVPRKWESRVPRPAVGGPDLEALWRHPSLRERTFWRMVHESGAPARAALALDVDRLDLPGRRGRASLRGREVEVRWGQGTAALLPGLIGDRTRGPLFLADRRPGPARMPAPTDLCPDTGRGRLSYERAEYLFKQVSGQTLHQL
ncbi:sigma-70 family RNA polymerase sigma factor [Nonomuraea sp. NPDC050556]|uniref:sigma-70 family RNA polymerase sigma factor n=1 Tax=Nonomuraea sp. NPDC050556 TaxID=3364369 RepID=UPI0037B5FC2D